MNIADLFLNLIYPPKCIFCRRMLGITAKRSVCGECEAEKLLLKDRACCIRCGKPIASWGEKQLCWDCMNRRHFYCDRVISAFEYKTVVRASILRYKANHSPAYAGEYAGYMAEIFKKEMGEDEFKRISYIVGVPPDRARERARGSDPVGVLCEALSRKLGLTYLKGVLKKAVKTKKQARLGYYERWDNVKESVRATDPEKIKGCTFILVDDICTTGATLEECARELKYCGAKRVYALTVASAFKFYEGCKG